MTESTTTSRSHFRTLFRVTHPFHPRFGRTYEAIELRRSGTGPSRFLFYDEEGRLDTVLLSCTDQAPPDPFVVIAAGRSHFRVEDLLRLSTLIKALEESGD
jgi:hypothetical protein